MSILSMGKTFSTLWQLRSEDTGWQLAAITFTHLDHLMDVALRPRELCGVLHFDQDDEVEVVPHVVLWPDVLLKRHVLIVKRLKVSMF